MRPIPSTDWISKVFPSLACASPCSRALLRVAAFLWRASKAAVIWASRSPTMTESSSEALSIMEWPRVVREEREDWWAEILDSSACVCARRESGG